jgi:hypothetical protein
LVSIKPCVRKPRWAAVKNPTALASSVSRPGPLNLILPIVGMTCASCVGGVEKAFQKVRGRATRCRTPSAYRSRLSVR